MESLAKKYIKTRKKEKVKKAHVLSDCDDTQTEITTTYFSYFTKEKNWNINDFEIKTTMIGHGKFGSIYLAREKHSKYKLVLKILKKDELKLHDIDYHEEINNHIKASDHSNIIKMYGYFDDTKRVYIMMEYASRGDVYTEGEQWSEQKTSTYIRDIAHALMHCHSKGIIHRDVKPENILLTKENIVKLCDFGWSVQTNGEKVSKLCGTLDYLCPQMVVPVCEEYSFECDIWSLGVLMYEFLVGKPPFFSTSYGKTYNNIRNEDPTYPTKISKEAKNLLEKLLVKDGKQRISLSEVIKHTWIVQNSSNYI
jgi:serine/threonine protein kinase